MTTTDQLAAGQITDTVYTYALDRYDGGLALFEHEPASAPDLEEAIAAAPSCTKQEARALGFIEDSQRYGYVRADAFMVRCLFPHGENVKFDIADLREVIEQFLKAHDVKARDLEALVFRYDRRRGLPLVNQPAPGDPR